MIQEPALHPLDLFDPVLAGVLALECPEDSDWIDPARVPYVTAWVRTALDIDLDDPADFGGEG